MQTWAIRVASCRNDEMSSCASARELTPGTASSATALSMQTVERAHKTDRLPLHRHTVSMKLPEGCESVVSSVANSPWRKWHVIANPKVTVDVFRAKRAAALVKWLV